MMLPVLEALKQNSELHIDILALTMARPVLRKHGFSCLGFKDFVQPADDAALTYGKELARHHHHPDSGIEEEESIAYLGLSYADLVQRLGQSEAERQWQDNGRQAFHPVSILSRVIDHCRPDLVIATNSPRSERAALDVARIRGIPTLCMVDLFGYMDFHVLGADYYTVFSRITVDNLLQTGVKEPRERFFITGNPVFDEIFDTADMAVDAQRSQYLPDIDKNSRLILWADVPGYFRNPPNVWRRSEEEVLTDLHQLATAAAANGAFLLVRPHPSQQSGLHERWIKTAPAHVRLVKDIPLYPLMKMVDGVITYASTTGLEALLMHKPLIQLRYFPEDNGMPLSDWGMALTVKKPDELVEAIRRVLEDDDLCRSIQKKAAGLVPHQKAAPLVVNVIMSLLSGN